jgi:beta-galactosidase
MKIWLSVMLAGAAALAVADTNWTRVAVVDVHAPAGGGFASGSTPYRYTEKDLPAADFPAGGPERDLLFGTELSFRFTALNPAARYELRARFLSDGGDRAQQILINDAVVEERLVLPRAQVVEKVWPAGVDGGQSLALTIRKLDGPNAVLSGLEVWSSDPTALQAPPGLAEALRATPVEIPALTPRPVEGVRSLDGTWRFSAEPAAGFESLEETPDAWKPIEVPGEWVMQGFTVPAGQAAGYRHSFQLPRDLRGRRLKLRFSTVHSLCRVWVNGTLVGTNESCFLPFECDITAAARPGRNVLALSVTSDSVSDVLASASKYAGHALGGITRKVELFNLPADHVAALHLDADYDPATSNGLLRARIALARESELDVLTTLFDPAGEAVAAGQGPAPALTVRNAAAWDPEHPRLYRVRVEVKDGDRVLQAVERRVGFRRVEVRGNQLLVNGRPVKLRGANRHETDPERGRSLTPARWREDVERFRSANVNYIRTSHYPPAEEFLDLCDEYGFFVECEAPFCWVQHGANDAWQTWNFRDEKFFPRLVRGNLLNVAVNRGHPSVVIWSLANESRWSELWAEVHRRVREADPTRPTAFHDQCWGGYNNAHSTAEIGNHHYPDESGPARCTNEVRPVLFGEYAHVQTYNRRELAADPGVRDDWGRGFVRMYDLMYRHEGCLGGAIWAGIDDVFCLPGGKYIGYGMWGSVCDGWRREKPETWHVRKVYSPVRVGVRTLPRPGPGRPLLVPVENRYNFTDLAEVGIAWGLGAETGLCAAALAPRAAGTLVITPSNPVPRGAKLRLAFTDPRGFVCDEEVIAVDPPSPAAPSPYGHPIKLASTAETLELRSRDFTLIVDRRTGLIREGRAGETVVLAGGPELMALPLRTEACAPVDLGRVGAAQPAAGRLEGAGRARGGRGHPHRGHLRGCGRLVRVRARQQRHGHAALSLHLPPRTAAAAVGRGVAGPARAGEPQLGAGGAVDDLPARPHRPAGGHGAGPAARRPAALPDAAGGTVVG